MLKGMRKSAKQILWPLIIALVITMGGYGVWYLVRPEVAESKVGVIWGKNITLEDFKQTYWVASAFTMWGGQKLTQEQLFKITWQRLLLGIEAEKTGISTTRTELARALAGFSIFQIDGKFNPDRYNRILSQFQLEAATFEKQVQKLLSIEKLQATIQNQALVSQAEIDETYQRMNEQIKVEYIQVLKDASSDQVEIPEPDLKEYYEQNQSQFTIQTRIDIQYIVISRERFKDTITIDPEEVETRYREAIADFSDQTGKPPAAEEMKEAIRAELMEKKCQEEAVQLAKKINRDLADYTTLEPLAKEFSLPIKQSGYFLEDEAIPELGDFPEINDLAFGMDIDEIVSYAVPVDEGFIFFIVTGKKDASLIPFDKAKEEIRTILNEELTEQETLKVARDELTELRKLMTDEEFDFESAAKELELEPKTTLFFTREGDESLPVSPSFIQAAFLTPPGQVSNLVPIEDGYAFLTVIERKPAGPMPEDEQEKWENLTRRGKAMLVYDTWFNNLIRESKFSITNKELAP
jgi:peptidyl-prolyl cis-trans isomerase D